MNKITKKEFIKLLEENKSKFIYFPGGLSDNKACELIEFIPTIKDKQIENIEVRIVSKVKSNSIVFSNGSMLDFNQKEKRNYCKEGDFLLFVTRSYCEFNEKFVNQVLAYKLV